MVRKKLNTEYRETQYNSGTDCAWRSQHRKLSVTLCPNALTKLTGEAAPFLGQTLAVCTMRIARANIAVYRT